MEIAGSAIGIVSLGIQTCHSLLEYYEAWKDLNVDIDRTYACITDLESSLALLKSQLEANTLNDIPVQRVKDCLLPLEEDIARLSRKLKKLRTFDAPQGIFQRVWSDIQRLHYPFRISTLAKLQETVDNAQHRLHLAIKLLGIDITLDTRDTTARIEALMKATALRTGALESNLSVLSSDAQGISKDLHILDAKNDAFLDMRILEWLSPSNFWDEHQSASQQRHSGTNQWILESQTYRTWRETEGSSIMCTGIPGAGKTVAASVILDDLALLCSTSSGYSLAFWFCNYRRYEEQTARVILSSLLMQLCRATPSVPQIVRDLSQRYGFRAAPSLQEIREAICVIASGLPRVFMVVDAVDECPIVGGCRSALIDALKKIQGCARANLLVTTRDLPEVTSNFENASQLKISARETDIQAFLDSQWNRLPSFVRRNDLIGSQIRQRITISASGMFLLVRLNFESLLNVLNLKEVKIMLSRLPTGSDAYDAAYHTIMERIDGRGSGHARLARKALTWLVYSKRPLRASELQHALAIEIGMSAFDDDNLVAVEDLISTCAGLLEVDDKRDYIRLTHYTAQEYFERTHALWCPESTISLIERCATYLSYDSLNEELDRYTGELPKTLKSYPFYEYAVENWVSHAIQSHERDSADQTPLTGNPRLTDSCLLWMMQNKQLAEAKWLLEHGAAGKLHDGEFKTPLHYAVLNGWVDCVRLLLRNGTNLTTDYNNMSELHYSVATGDAEMVRVMLEANIPVDTVVQRRIWVSTQGLQQQGSRRIWERRHDLQPPPARNAKGKGLTALHYAALTGSATMTRLLLEKGADPNAMSEYGESPLQLAIKQDVLGHTWASGVEDYWNIPQLKTEYSLDLVDFFDEEEYSLVQAGVDETRAAVIDALLHHPRTDHSLQDCFGTSLLHSIRYGSRASRRTLTALLNKGVEIDMYDCKGRTALHLACLTQDLEAIRVLLDSGADPTATNNSGMNAFHHAAQSGSVPALQLVHQAASRSDIRSFAQRNDGYGRNALHMILGKGGRFVDLDTVQYLIDVGVRVNDLDSEGYSPLARYMKRFLDRSTHKAEIAEYLFGAGADARFTTSEGLNLAHLSTFADKLGCQLLRVLRENGVGLRSRDNKGRTILHHCALHGSLESEEALNFLCDSVGLSLDSTDIDGKTPLDMCRAMRSKDHHPMLFRPDRWEKAEGCLRRNKK